MVDDGARFPALFRLLFRVGLVAEFIVRASHQPFLYPSSLPRRPLLRDAVRLLRLLYVPNALLSAVVLFFEVLPFSGVSFDFSMGATSCYTTGLLLCTDKFQMRRRVKIIAAAIAFLATITCVFATNIP